MQLRFANREYELEQVCNPATKAHKVIDAPAGYGKTFLLDEVKRRYRENNWQCALVHLEQHKGKSSIRDAITDEIGAHRIEAFDDQDADARLRQELVKNGKLILLFDSVERADDRDLTWLLTELIPDCEKGLRGLEFRVIFAGRYTHAAESAASKWPNNYHHIELRAFTQEVVQKVIEDATQECPPKDPHRKLQKDDHEALAKQVLRLSGGHPRSIQKLVAELTKSDWSLTFSLGAERGLFQNCVHREIDAVIGPLDDTTKTLLETLTIFRFFTLGTIVALQKRTKLPKEIDARKIFLRLTSLGLVAKRPTDPFYSDAIVRNLYSRE